MFCCAGGRELVDLVRGRRGSSSGSSGAHLGNKFVDETDGEGGGMIGVGGVVRVDFGVDGESLPSTFPT